MNRRWYEQIRLWMAWPLFALVVSIVQLQAVPDDNACSVPPPGEMVDIGGYRLHLYRKGYGSPTVVIDSGLGGISTDWALIQDEIAKFTQVVSYDRAGIAWSDPGPLPRTSQKMVEELHALLKKADIPSPYILVGASFGGNNVQLFAATYPDEVGGLVLVDSSHETQLSSLPPHPLVDLIPLMQDPSELLFKATFGLDCFVTQKYLASKLPLLPTPIRERRIAFHANAQHLSTIALESRSLSESLQELADADRSRIQTIPCFVLTMGQSTNLSDFGITETNALESANRKLVVWQSAWNQLQKDLADKFTHSQHLIAEKSDHAIMWHQPELIVEAVRDIFKRSKTHLKGRAL